MGARVVGVDASGVDITDTAGTTSRLDSAGRPVGGRAWKASPLAAELAKATGAELDRAGRIAVLPDCSLPDHPEVFVVGDMMALDKLPGVAEVAMQGGVHAANTIVRRVGGEPARPFKYRDLGSAATIGRFRSVVDFRGLRLSGFPGWVVWAFVHLAFLTGFGNRLTTLLKWTRSFIGRGRPEREFSVMHIGGELSLPPEVRALVQPRPLPVYVAAAPRPGGPGARLKSWTRPNPAAPNPAAPDPPAAQPRLPDPAFPDPATPGPRHPGVRRSRAGGKATRELKS